MKFYLDWVGGVCKDTDEFSSRIYSSGLREISLDCGLSLAARKHPRGPWYFPSLVVSEAAKLTREEAIEKAETLWV